LDETGENRKDAEDAKIAKTNHGSAISVSMLPSSEITFAASSAVIGALALSLPR